MNGQSRTRWGLVLLAMVLILSAVACGEPASEEHAEEAAAGERSGAPAEREELDVCSLYSKEEAEAALGEAVNEPEAGWETCEYEAASGTATLHIVAQEMGSEAAQDERIALLGLDDEGNEAVPDLGDRAFFTGSQLVVFEGSRMVTVTVGLFGDRGSRRQEVAVAVAQAVLSRL